MNEISYIHVKICLFYLITGYEIIKIICPITNHKNRTATYSLLPTITTIIGIPGALIGGYILKTSPFSSAILVKAIFSGIGVILTRMGLSKLPEIKGNDFNASSNSK